MNFLHSGCIGDLIYFLPVIKYYGKGNLYLDTTIIPHMKIDSRCDDFPPKDKFSGKYKLINCGLNSEKIKSLVSLLKFQPYISNVKIWEGEYIDIHNNIPYFIHIHPGKPRDKNLCEFILTQHNIPLKYIKSSWIFCNSVTENNHVVISRSFRYRNNKFPWKFIVKKFNKKIIFVGNKDEYKDFCSSFGYVDYFEGDFLNICVLIKSSLFFIGNQSACYALAEAMKVKTLQETSPSIPDCIFKREEAEYFIQKGNETEILNPNILKNYKLVY